MLRTRERPPILYPFVVFTFGLIVESIQKFGGASKLLPNTMFNHYSPSLHKGQIIIKQAITMLETLLDMFYVVQF
jgi:hypothetical protein